MRICNYQKEYTAHVPHRRLRPVIGEMHLPLVCELSDKNSYVLKDPSHTQERHMSCARSNFYTIACRALAFSRGIRPYLDHRVRRLASFSRSAAQESIGCSWSHAKTDRALSSIVARARRWATPGNGKDAKQLNGSIGFERAAAQASNQC